MSAALVNDLDDDLAETGALYAGFAAAFHYPEAPGWLTAPEYLAAFDPGASAEATSLHEAAYARMDTGALFEELVRFYEHFGLRRQEKAELPDHLAVELEFMHVLCALDQAAVERGEAADAVHAAQRDFLDRHLRPLLAGLLDKRTGRADRATALIEACRDLVAAHRAALDD